LTQSIRRVLGDKRAAGEERESHYGTK